MSVWHTCPVSVFSVSSVCLVWAFEVLFLAAGLAPPHPTPTSHLSDHLAFQPLRRRQSRSQHPTRPAEHSPAKAGQRSDSYIWFQMLRKCETFLKTKRLNHTKILLYWNELGTCDSPGLFLIRLLQCEHLFFFSLYRILKDVIIQ